jgi:hypothetical protein
VETVTVDRVVINWEAAYATNYQLQIASSAAGPFTTLHMDRRDLPVWAGETRP